MPKSNVSYRKLRTINPSNIKLMYEYLDFKISCGVGDSTIKNIQRDLETLFIWNMDFNGNGSFITITDKKFQKFLLYCSSVLDYSTEAVNRITSNVKGLNKFVLTVMDDKFKNYSTVLGDVEAPVASLIKNKFVITEKKVDVVLDKLVDMGKYQASCILALCAFSGIAKSDINKFKWEWFKNKNIMNNVPLYRMPEPLSGNKYISQVNDVYKNKPIKYVLLDFKKYYDLWMTKRIEKGINKCEYLFVDNEDKQLSSDYIEYYLMIISELFGQTIYFQELRPQLCTRLHRVGVTSELIKDFYGWNDNLILNRNNKEIGQLVSIYSKMKEVKNVL